MINSGNVRGEAAPALAITPQSLLELRQPSSPAFHPDGHRIVFELDEADFTEGEYRSHLWITEWVDEDAPEGQPVAEETEGGNLPEPDELTRQLTFSTCSEWSPQWSPDGSLLAFLSDRPDPAASDDDEDAEAPTVQIWVLPAEGGEARKVTSARDGVLAYRWFPDSSSLLALAPEPRPAARTAIERDNSERRKIDPIAEPEKRPKRRLWRVFADSSGARPELIHVADPGVVEIAISPDCGRICFASNGTGDPNQLHLTRLNLLTYLEDQDTWELKVLCERGGDKSSLRWSPDGRRIAVLSSLGPELSFSRQSLYLLDVPDAPLFEPVSMQLALPEWDRDVLEVEWTSPTSLVGIAAHGTVDELFLISQLGEVSPTLNVLNASENVCCHGLTVDLESGALCWVEESAQSLPELYTMRGDQRASLTRLNAEFCERRKLPVQRVIRWEAEDGTCIEGVLTLPHSYQEGIGKLPLLLHLHGGPHSRAVNTLQGYAMAPVWAEAGFAVLAPNYRGSEGYGAEFALLSRFDLGGADLRDCLAGVDYCIQMGIADAENLAVMGGSYGGFLTNWAIAADSRFKAAISMFGIFSLKADAGTSVFSRWNYEYLGGYFWQQPERYARLSPDRLAANIHTPTLIIHGEEDDNTYPGNSRELYQTLHQRGVPVSYVRYPREGHGLSEPAHRLDEMRRCTAWMRRWIRSRVPCGIGDFVACDGGNLELCVLTASPLPQNVQEGDEPTTRLEISFVLSSTQKEAASEPCSPKLRVPLSSLTLAPSHTNEPMLTPVGVTAEAHGVKSLITGDNLLLTAPNAPTGQHALTASVVFELPESPFENREALFQMPGYAPVLIVWEDAPDDELETGM
jgi:dipeptidyl aminopeptidase/acylaminoacyl peptidase